jgi:hypothetical protein
MAKSRFLNQKLGKRTDRKVALTKFRVSAEKSRPLPRNPKSLGAVSAKKFNPCDDSRAPGCIQWRGGLNQPKNVLY